MVTHSSILAWKKPMDRGARSPWNCRESDSTEHLSAMFVHFTTKLQPNPLMVQDWGGKISLPETEHVEGYRSVPQISGM